MKSNLLFLSLIIILSSCDLSSNKEEDPTVLNPHHSAMPDSDVDIETELSEEDKRKISEASGKKAEPISIAKLNALLENSEKTTNLVFIWSNEGGQVKSSLKTLRELSSQTETEKLDIILLHIGEKSSSNDVSAIVREYGIDGDIYLIESKSELVDISGHEGEWGGELPVYYVYSSEDKTGLWFDGKMEYAELYVMIQPFIM